ncbi:hypothetical protein CVV38_02290 [Candidatus Peregrinibacteria bacterium HGW-Peregrinibacteria-1]|jgi:hypothetical protein|nr:MAG: hypothetical protein CVV38_02290 [Candidatus Peregrinibacteria bacterium HGW-Peregrinibacteria-1]
MAEKKTNKKIKKRENEDVDSPVLDDTVDENEVVETDLEESMDGKSLLLDKKRVLYLEIDDEVIDIYHRIMISRHKFVYLVVPQRAILFQSLINLKILKKKTEDDGKEIFLISNDEKGVNLAHKAGIPVYEKEDEQGVTRLFSSVTEDDQMKITPMRATVNSVEEEAPTRLSERKMSIAQLLNKSANLDDRLNSSDAVATAEKKTKKIKSNVRVVIPNRRSLMALIVTSVLVLLVIVYIALPGATIYLTPAASVLDTSINITLAEAQRNSSELRTNPDNMIASYRIKSTSSQSLTYTATGKRFSDRGANPKGTISIVNTTTSPWPLIANTRFQTDEGIVFRISQGVTVPAAGLNGPGKLDVSVEADEVDASGQVVGERGNIGPSRFFLPGLSEANRSKIYGESSEPMSGGVTDFITFARAEDIEGAKEMIRGQLVEGAVEKMRGEVATQDVGDGLFHDFVLLEADRTITVSEPRIQVDETIVGQDIEEFTISGEIDVFGIFYDRRDMLNILTKQLEINKSPQKKLMEISEDSVTYRVFELNDAEGKIRLTANIKGIELYDIDTDTENGQRLINKIRDRILGMEMESAKAYIQNLPEVNSVRIDSWPAWSPTLPKIEDNIDFVVVDAVNTN